MASRHEPRRLASSPWRKLASSPGSTGSTRSTARVRRPASCSQSCGGCCARPRSGARAGAHADERRRGGGRAPTHGAGAGHNRHVICPLGRGRERPRRSRPHRRRVDQTSAGRPGRRRSALKRIRIDPGKWSTPFHRQTAEEEIFFVLAGSGICLLRTVPLRGRPGDCLVHRVREAHTLRAGDDGLDVLAFGTRGQTEAAHLPRAGVVWLGGSWVEAGTGEPPVGARGRRRRAGAAGGRRAPRERRATSTRSKATTTAQWRVLARHGRRRS